MKNIQSVCENLLKPVKIVEGIVEKRQTLPILSNILIEQNGENVKFSATDLDIQISTEAPVGVAGVDTRFTVGASKLASILTALPATNEVQFDLGDRGLTISSNNGKFQLQTLSADEYPVLKESQWETTLFIPSRTLRYLLTMTAFAMASQDVRYYLNGVLFVVEGKKLRTVATDTHRLACYEVDVDDENTPMQAIIPRKTVRELIRLLPEDDTPVRVQFTDLQVCFSFGNITFMSKLIEGRFPDYKRVLPSQDTNPNALELEREAISNALRRVGIMTNEKFHGIRWILNGEGLQIQSTNSDHEEALERFDVPWTHDELDMGFNITYLLEVLGILKNKTVRFNFSTASGSVLITMPESQERFRYVVMPMRI